VAAAVQPGAAVRAAGAGLTTWGLRSGLLLAAMLVERACLRLCVDRGRGGWISCTARLRPRAVTTSRAGDSPRNDRAVA
jgi:hypothetical protein